MENCNNCAWFCHTDGKCYGVEGVANGYPPIPDGCECSVWTFDGLEEWEREQMLLMTMENKAS